MKLDFAKNTKRNIVANAFSNGIKLVFPFLNRTLFLWLLGPEYLGLNGLFGSILGVLMLAELGFGTAIVCSMYKPVADNNRELLCAYLKFYRKVYRWVGGAIFAVGLCLLPFLRQLVHGSVPPDIDLHILYLIHLINTSASYFLFAYRGSILGAHHRNDVITNIRTGVSIAQYVTVFLILLITRNYYHYIIATVAFTVAQNILLVRASRKYFPDIEPRGVLSPDRRRQVISDVKSIFLHKVGGVISNSLGNLVVSAFLGLVAVAAYGNYYYVYTTVTGLVGIIYTSMMGGFGNKIYTETKEENFALVMKVNRLTLIVAVWCAAMMTALYQPFITIWVKRNPELVQHMLTVVLMVALFLVNISRQVLLTFKAAAALWKQDRWKPLVAGAFNISVCILLMYTVPDGYKLDGVILGTLAGYTLIQIPWETHVVFSVFFNGEQAKRYWRQQGFFAVVALVLCVVTGLAVSFIPLDRVVGLLVKGGVAAAISGGLMLAVFRNDLLTVLEAMRKRRSEV